MEFRSKTLRGERTPPSASPIDPDTQTDHERTILLEAKVQVLERRLQQEIEGAENLEQARRDMELRLESALKEARDAKNQLGTQAKAFHEEACPPTHTHLRQVRELNRRLEEESEIRSKVLSMADAQEEELADLSHQLEREMERALQAEQDLAEYKRETGRQAERLQRETMNKPASTPESAEVEQLRHRLAESVTEANSLRKDAEGARETIAGLHSRVNEVTTQRENERRLREDAERNADEAKEAQHDAERESSSSVRDAARARESAAKATQELDRTRIAHEKAISMLQNELDEVEMKVSDGRSRIAELERRNQSLQEKNKRQEVQIGNLMDQLGGTGDEPSVQSGHLREQLSSLRTELAAAQHAREETLRERFEEERALHRELHDTKEALLKEEHGHLKSKEQLQQMAKGRGDQEDFQLLLRTAEADKAAMRMREQYLVGELNKLGHTAALQDATLAADVQELSQAQMNELERIGAKLREERKQRSDVEYELEQCEMRLKKARNRITELEDELAKGGGEEVRLRQQLEACRHEAEMRLRDVARRSMMSDELNISGVQQPLLLEGDGKTEAQDPSAWQAVVVALILLVGVVGASFSVLAGSPMIGVWEVPT